MKLVYCDEAGDPGYPKYQSPCFILSFLYFNVQDWNKCFKDLLNIRRELKKEYGLPVRLEFHTREFFLNKNPYTRLKLSNNQRIKIINKLIDGIAKLSCYNVKVITIAIIKDNIKGKYAVLDKAFTYGLQRLDNNLHYDSKKEHRLYQYGKFLLLLDEGYLHKVKKISRKLSRYNYVPYEGGEGTRPIKIESIIDDPLPKNSKDSYFIQTIDLIVYLISQYIYIKLGESSSPKRKKFIGDDKIIAWVEKLRPIFNIDACPKSKFGYGIVHHPHNKKSGL